MLIHNETPDRLILETADVGWQTPGVSEIIIDKRRNGPTGVVKLAWIPSQGRFEDLELSE